MRLYCTDPRDARRFHSSEEARNEADRINVMWPREIRLLPEGHGFLVYIHERGLPDVYIKDPAK